MYCELIAVCTDLSGKEPHRQVGVGKMVTSGSLGGVMVGILARNASDVSLIAALGAMFTIFVARPSPSMVLASVTSYVLYGC